MLCYFGNWNHRSKGKAYTAENRREMEKKNKVTAVWFFNTKMALFSCYKIKT